MFKYRFTLSIGFSGCEHEEVMSYDDEPSEEELEQDWQEWSSNYIDGGYHKED